MSKRENLARSFRNFSALTIGKVAGDFFVLILFVLVSRRFGQEGIGYYSFAMALTGLVAVIAEFGLYNLTVRELSRHAFGPDGPWRTIFPFRLTLSVIAFGVLLIVVPLLPLPWEARLIVGIIGSYQIIYVLFDGVAAVFVAREDMHVAGLLELSLRATITIAGTLTIVAGGGLPLALVSFPVAALLHLGIGYALIAKRHRRPPLIASWSELGRTARDAVPFALSSLIFPVASRFDVVCLGFILGAAAAGVYNVAFRVIFVLLVITRLASMAIFPLASRAHLQSPAASASLYHRAMRITVLASVPMAGGLWFIAPELVTWIFGSAFAESGVVLQGLAWLLCLGGLKRVLDMFLMASDREAERTAIQWLAAGVNVGGNLILIPLAGIQGAIAATIIADLLLVLLFALRLRPTFGWPRIGPRLAASVLATATFMIVVYSLPPLPVLAVIPLSAGIYAAVLLLFPSIRDDEAGLVLTLVRRSPIRPSRSTAEP